MKTPTLHELQAVWRKILENPEAVGALARLKRDGFPISRRDLNEHPSWASHIASIPFLPNRNSRRRLRLGKDLQKHMSLVKVLREFAINANNPLCEIRVLTRKKGRKKHLTEILLDEGSREFGRELGNAADLIEKLTCSNWSVRDRNARNTMIAFLRGTIRYRTGTSHDKELASLIDAAFTAAGKEPPYFDTKETERIERLEMEGRVKAACRLNYVSGESASPLPDVTLSTRSSTNRRKGVE
jgi:hypothetical protein